MGQQSFIVFDRSHLSSLAIPLLGRLVTKPEWPFDACYPPVLTPNENHLPIPPHNTTRTFEQFETGESVTGEALRARKGWCHIAKVLGGAAEISHLETYELTSPRITTMTLINPDAVLETLLKSTRELDKFSSNSHHRLYMMIALRMAETPRAARTARRCSTVRGEITVPIGAALGEATLSRVGDVGASAQTDVSKGSTFITTAEGEQAFAAQYIEVVVDKGILRRSLPTLRPKGKFIPGKETLTLFAGPSSSRNGDDNKVTIYTKTLELS